MNQLINNSDPGEMLKVSKKIASYADTLKKDMKNLEIFKKRKNGIRKGL